MTKKPDFDFNTNWYEIWMKQSKDFFTTADENLKNMFPPSGFAKPEEHLKQINQWLDMLKMQWQYVPLTDEQKAYQTYWKMMSKMGSDAADMMVDQWLRKSRQEQPVKTLQELYELWIKCCQEVYQQAIQSKAYQEAYGEFMTAAFKFWKDGMPK